MKIEWAKVAFILGAPIIAALTDVTSARAEQTKAPEAKTSEADPVRAPSPNVDEKTKAEAAKAFEQGVAHFREQRYEEALAAFEKAYRLRPAWKLLFNLAQCRAALKHWGCALENFERYLTEGGDEIADERRELVLKEIVNLRVMVGTIKVFAPPGYDVYVDGHYRAKSDASAQIRDSAGVEHVVQLFKNGKAASSKKTVTIASLGTMEVYFDALDLKAENLDDAKSAPVGSSPSQKDRKERGTSLAPAWILGGATLVCGGGAIVLTAISKKKHDEAFDNPDDKGATDAFDGLRKATIGVLAATASTAIATAIVTGALLSKRRAETDEPVVSVGVVPSSEAPGIAIVGRF